MPRRAEERIRRAPARSGASPCFGRRSGAKENRASSLPAARAWFACSTKPATSSAEPRRPSSARRPTTRLRSPPTGSYIPEFRAESGTWYHSPCSRPHRPPTASQGPMRLPVKLSLLLSAATCFPLLLATAFTLPRGREALRSQLDEIYAQDARTLAGEVHRTLVDKLDSLTLAASTLRLHELDPEAREQALLLIYKETRGADIVGLFDSRADAVGNIIRFARLQGVLASEHEPIDDAALSMYAGKVPLQGALQAGLAIGPVYILPDAEGRPIPRLVLAVAVPGTRGTRWVVAVEVSLRRLADSFERFRPGESGAAFLVDGEGKVIFHPNRELMLKRVTLRDHPLLKGTRSDDWLGANSPLPPT